MKLRLMGVVFVYYNFVLPIIHCCNYVNGMRGTVLAQSTPMMELLYSIIGSPRPPWRLGTANVSVSIWQSPTSTGSRGLPSSHLTQLEQALGAAHLSSLVSR